MSSDIPTLVARITKATELEAVKQDLGELLTLFNENYSQITRLKQLNESLQIENSRLRSELDDRQQTIDLIHQLTGAPKKPSVSSVSDETSTMRKKPDLTLRLIKLTKDISDLKKQRNDCAREWRDYINSVDTLEQTSVDLDLSDLQLIIEENERINSHLKKIADKKRSMDFKVKDERAHFSHIVPILLHNYFRKYFGVYSLQRCGHFVDSVMTRMVDSYGFWINYKAGNQTGKAHKSLIKCMAISKDGRYLYTASLDHSIACWDLRYTLIIRQWEGHRNEIYSLALRNECLASGSRDNTIRIWNAYTHEWMASMEGHTNTVNALAFDENGKMLISGSFDRTIRIWKVDTAECLRVITGHTNRIYSVKLVGDQIVSGAEDRSIRVWSKRTGIQTGMLGSAVIPGLVWDVCFNSDRSLLACVCLNQPTMVFQWPNMDEYRRVEPSHSLCFHPTNPQWLALGNRMYSIKVFDLESERCILTLEGHTDRVRALGFTPDAQRLISTSQDTSVRVWDVSSMSSM